MTLLTDPYDLLIIGGGINGAGIARDAAGRNLSVVLVDSGDLGGATSSASTKLIHGGLRYLEFYAYGLVRKALAEREVLLDSAPHISWPQSFVLPQGGKAGARPAWMLRAGLFLYDRLAKRRDVPGSSRVDLHNDRAGHALSDRDAPAFRYWDGWMDDARLVIANCQDAAARGAVILPRTAAVSAQRVDDCWAVTLSDGQTVRARRLVNAAGPWAEDVARRVLGFNDAPALKLVQGTHIVTKRVHLGSDAFMLQQPDGRVVFIIPYERDFSLIGTTERAIAAPEDVDPSEAEIDYLIEAANRWLARPLTREAVLHSFAGVRPLVLEPGKDDRETTRDWQLVHHAGGTAISVIGGKLTTYRLLAEDVMQHLPSRTGDWTAGVPLPGGDVPREADERGNKERGQAAFKRWLEALILTHEHYDPALIKRLAYTLGTACAPLLEAGLGAKIGGMWEAELRHFREREWARCAQDVLWRRTKMGLRAEEVDAAAIDAWFDAENAEQSTSQQAAPAL